jgi:hypothetical protein
MCRHSKFRAKQVLRDFDVRLLLVGVLVPDEIEERKRYNGITVQGVFASTSILDICWHRGLSGGLTQLRSITNTAVYTALAPNRFEDFWRD